MMLTIIYLCLTSYILNFTILVSGLIPKPFEQIQSNSLCVINESIRYRILYNKCFILQEAIRRFNQKLTYNENIKLKNVFLKPNCSIQFLRINIEEGCNEMNNFIHQLWPSDEMKEQYNISIHNSTIHIESVQVWGALHALETVMQLVYKTSKQINVIFETTIRDHPQFVHRGYLIDTSRHYLSLDKIKTFISAMAMVKMNVLHWHIVDDSSFPYVSYTFPNLSTQGAYHPQAYIYTHNDVKQILNYARYRGIRVIAEFDTPGHTQSWGKGYREILTECYDKFAKLTGKLGPVNPVNNFTYQFMSKLYSEILNVFPDNVVHLGGDEVEFNCWKSNPEIQTFMKKHMFDTDYNKLEIYYIKKLIELINSIKPVNKPIKTIIWQEIFQNGFRSNNSTIIHVWKLKDWTNVMKNVTAAGYPVLFSACWYLDIINYGSDWDLAYDCNFMDFGGSPDQIKLIQGGEAAMWGEFVDDTNLISRSWPRGAAVAERLWTTNTSMINEFAERLDELRCRMLKWGIDAEPVNGASYCPP